MPCRNPRGKLQQEKSASKSQLEGVGCDWKGRDVTPNHQSRQAVTLDPTLPPTCQADRARKVDWVSQGEGRGKGGKEAEGQRGKMGERV